MLIQGVTNDASLNGDNPVYDQYLKYYNEINSDISKIWGDPNYQKFKSQIDPLVSDMQKAQKDLYTIYQKDASKTLDDFINDAKATVAKYQNDFTEAETILDGSPSAKAIEKDYEKAKGEVASLIDTIQENENHLSSLEDEEKALSQSTIPELQEAIQKLQDPTKKAQAENLFKKLQSQNQKLQSDIATAKTEITGLDADLKALTDSGSNVSKLLQDLKTLSEEKNPTDADVQKADSDVKSIESNSDYTKADQDLTNFEKGSVATLNADISEIKSTISAIDELLPEPPSSRFEIYSDNWAIPDGHLPIPSIPDGADINYSFGEVYMGWKWNGSEWVVNSDDPKDGTWLANQPGAFPVDPSNIVGTLTSRMPEALAIGGWNASQDKPGFDPKDPKSHYAYQENDLFQILSSPNQKVRENFINTIVNTASKDGYKKVIMDYENYSHGHQEGDNYTNFLIELDQKLQALNPPVKLEMAISPAAKNEDYYNLQELVSKTKITFEPMNYDYAAGVDPKIVTPNASTGQTMDYLKALEANGVPANRMKMGFSTYGQAFNLAPGTSLQDVLKGLNSKSGLPFTSDWTGECPVGTPNGGNGQISNDQIFKLLGGSEANPWQPGASSSWKTIVYHDPNHPGYPPEVFYYNATGGNNGSPLLISAQTSQDVSGISSATGQEETAPSAIDALVKAVDTELPGNAGFFGWDAMEDENSVTLKEVMKADQKYHQ